MSELFEMGLQVMRNQPFSQLLGTELTLYEPGRAELRLANRAELKQQYGYVHGGVLSYLADNALTYAGGSVLGLQVITSEFKINYVRPAQGQTLIARSSAVSESGRQAVCECRVYDRAEDGQETLCAVAQGTIVRIGS